VILGLAALLLLPGFLVVRAPWTAVPFLSLFFWIASWWWLPFGGRGRFLAGALVAFILLAVLDWFASSRHGLRGLRPSPSPRRFFVRAPASSPSPARALTST